MRRLAIFASGGGSNAQAIIDYFAQDDNVSVHRVYSNKSSAYVLQRAQAAGIPSFCFNRDSFYHQDTVIQQLRSDAIDLIILAGFLWKLPALMVQTFSGRIINIHPSLLPKHGGKGMYGINVHKAVINAQERYSGLTIHHVTEHYDEGAPILQIWVPVLTTDTAEMLAARILKKEHFYYPRVIAKLLQQMA